MPEEDFKPLSLPKILDGRFFNNVQPNKKTPGGIQATCTACLGTFSGTTKSTGNFLSHIKRRHKEILASCQQYCQRKVNTASEQKVSAKHMSYPKMYTFMPTVIAAAAAAQQQQTPHNTINLPKQLSYALPGPLPLPPPLPPPTHQPTLTTHSTSTVSNPNQLLHHRANTSSIEGKFNQHANGVFANK